MDRAPIYEIGLHKFESYTRYFLRSVDLYELDEEKIKDKSYEDLEEEFYNDFEEFLDKYQKDEK